MPTSSARDGMGDEGLWPTVSEVVALVPSAEVTVLTVTDRRGSPGFLVELARSDRYRPAGRATSLEVAAQAVRRRRPDVVVVEIGSIERLEELVDRATAFADSAVVVVSSLPPEVSLATSFAAGARAFVAKPVERGMLESAVSAAAAGRTYVDPRATGWLVELALHGHRSRRQTGLTLRQSQVVQLVRGGLTNRQIARALSLSEETVKAHLRGAMTRLGVHDRWSATSVERARGRLQ